MQYLTHRGMLKLACSLSLSTSSYQSSTVDLKYSHFHSPLNAELPLGYERLSHLLANSKCSFLYNRPVSLQSPRTRFFRLFRQPHKKKNIPDFHLPPDTAL